MLQRVLLNGDLLPPIAALRIGDGRAHRALHLVLRERLKAEQAAARHDGRRHGDHGVFRGGADKADGARLNRGQDGIGLRLAPAVALVQQKIRWPPIHGKAAFRRLDDLAHVRHAAGDGVELNELAARLVRDDGSERGFARAGRAPEDGAGEPVGLDGAAQQPPRAHDGLLPDEFLQRAGAHAVGQRRELLVLRTVIGEKIHTFLPRAAVTR